MNSLSDPLVNEVREARNKHASKFDYDLKKIFDDIKARQKASGLQYIKYSPRSVILEDNEMLSNP